MGKTRMNFRLSEETILQFMELEKLELEFKKKYNLKPKSKTEILEEAMNQYYVSRMDSVTGDLYMDRIEKRLRGIFDQYFGILVDAINSNQLQNLKNTELILLFFKLLKVDVEKTKVDSALLMDSYIDEKVDEKLKKLIKK